MKNSFVYNEIEKYDLTEPFFAVNLPESYAQSSEDLLILGLIKAYSLKNNIAINQLSYLEIGANHPISTSSTYLFYKNYGMNGVLVEANPTLIPDLQKIRNRDIVINAAVTIEDVEKIQLLVPEANELATIDPNFLPAWKGEGASVVSEYTVDAIHINSIFENYFENVPPFYLSIDIEGNDIEVLRQINFNKHRPFILQVEPSEHYKLNSFLDINNILSSNNYSLLLKTDVNLIYIDNDNDFLKCYNKHKKPSTIVLGSSISEIFDYIFGDNPNYYPYWIDGWTARGLWKDSTQNYIKDILKDLPRTSAIFLNFGSADITVSVGYIMTRGDEFISTQFNADKFISQCIKGIKTTINTLKEMGFNNIYTFFYSPIPDFPKEYWDNMDLFKQPSVEFLNNTYKTLLEEIEKEIDVINLIPLFSRDNETYITSGKFQRMVYDHHLNYIKIQDIIWENIKELPGIMDRRPEPHKALYMHEESHVNQLIEMRETRKRTCR